MRALLAKSQFVEIERLTSFGPRLLDKSLKLGARTLVIDDFFPTLVALCKLTELIKHGTTLSLTEFWQLLDDFRCAHGSSILCQRGLVSAHWRTAKLCRQAFPRDQFHLLAEKVQLIERGVNVGRDANTLEFFMDNRHREDVVFVE